MGVDSGSTGADAQTLDAYDLHAAALATQYEAPSIRVALSKYLRVAFPSGSRVLDLGAGTGRDLASMASDGHHVYGIEPSGELRRAATRLHPNLAQHIVSGYLPGGLPPIDTPFDGILCSAVLQHIPSALLFDAAYAIRERLRSDGSGRLLLSVPRDRPDLNADGRDVHGRLFNRVKPEELALLFERIGFRRLDRWEDEDALGRQGIRWVTMLFVLQSSSGRPLDLVEAILSRGERKVATYKLALLRALAELATTRPHLAIWRDGGRAGVPVERIAERWLLYYWPLVEAGPGFRQIQGWKPMAFESELEALIVRFRKAGRLGAFATAWRRGALTADDERQRRRVMSRLQSTIVTGPVKYAGGGNHLVFRESGGVVWMDASLWSELSLMGHWILDALVLRWAEKTAELNTQTSVAEAVQLLRRPHDPDREQDIARQIYGNLTDLECVWTGRPLANRKYAIDHVLPYALWRSTDLWNLLPASPEANGNKSDRLPQRDLLESRRTAIERYWEHARDGLPRRFDTEARELCGTDAKSVVRIPRLFQVVCECVEVTATQRGAERWRPEIPNM